MTAQNVIQQVKAEIKEKKNNIITMQELIRQNAEEYKKVLPKHMNAERMTRIFVTALSLNPDLEKCTKKSFLGAIFMCAQTGLELNIDGQAYIIPFYNTKKINGQFTKVCEAHFVIGYKGYITLFYNSPNAVSIDMREKSARMMFLNTNTVQMPVSSIYRVIKALKAMYTATMQLQN